jgi:5-methylthioribose kinase
MDQNDPHISRLRFCFNAGQKFFGVVFWIWNERGLRMLNIEVENATDYLRARGWIGAAERVSVRALTGGVSNQVLYVQRQDGCGSDFVLKQARPQLRTPAPWFCGVERIWREVEVLRICEDVLAKSTQETDQSLTTSATSGGSSRMLPVQTPKILHEDRDNFAIAMSAAPVDHRVWKADLLAGRVEPMIAVQCGHLLGRLHAGTWQDADVARRLDDRQIFDELRLDPYYRAVASAFPDDAPHFERLIASVWNHRRSMVHADFSPKNLLVFEGPTGASGVATLQRDLSSRDAPVFDGGLMMVDFETGHFGDPAFDLGFFLSHLVLKAVFHAPDFEPYLDLTRSFWQAYRTEMIASIGEEEYAALVERTVVNFAGCMWARIDGKSRVEYLIDETRRGLTRKLCRSLFEQTPTTWDDVLARITQELNAVG